MEGIVISSSAYSNTIIPHVIFCHMTESNNETSWKIQFKEGLKWLRDSTDYVKVPKEVSKKRYAICIQCDSFESLTKQCRECACFMPLKTRMNLTPCPKGKWNLT